jgi:hypothetical protein
MRVAAYGRLLAILALLLLVLLPANSSPTIDRQPVNEALTWIRSIPTHTEEFDYIMSAKVRLLVFWLGKDDVGGGYIRRGVSPDDPRQEFFQVLFGSDPAKTPRAINRWGAGTEVSWHKTPVSGTHPGDDVTASAFFGFMKSSRGKSASEMQQELKKEKEEGLHAFTGILSRVDPSRAVSLVAPYDSKVDYNLHDYSQAEPLMLDYLRSSGQPIKDLNDPTRCGRSAEFLATIAELMDGALSGMSAPQSRCYIYDAQENTLTLEKVDHVASLPVQLHGPQNSVLLDTSYSDLLQLDFNSTHKLTGKRVYFSVLVGTKGDLRGVPVQVRYQPNWWFQVVLNLQPSKTPRPNAVAAR